MGNYWKPYALDMFRHDISTYLQKTSPQSRAKLLPSIHGVFLGVACLAVLRMTAVTQCAHLRWLKGKCVWIRGVGLACAIAKYMESVHLD